MAKLLEWLGLSHPASNPGFTRAQRAGQQPVCQECGALVAWEAQQKHLDWHARLAESTND